MVATSQEKLGSHGRIGVKNRAREVREKSGNFIISQGKVREIFDN